MKKRIPLDPTDMRVVTYSTDDVVEHSMRWVAYNVIGQVYAPVRHFAETEERAITLAMEFWTAELAKAAREREATETRTTALAAYRKARKQVRE